MAVDSASDLFIADLGNNRVRKVDTNGIITTIAGTGVAGFSGDGGPGTSAMVNLPQGVAVDGTGNIYIADSNSHRIRKLLGGTITTFAGKGVAGFSGDGGPATAAAIAFPLGVTVDNAGAILIADSNNHVIRQVNAAGIMSTVTANGEQGFFGDNGPLAVASLDTPSSVLPLNGGLFIADKNNQRVRRTGPPVVIAPPDYELLTPSVSASVVGNQSASFPITVNPIAGFSGQVSLTCSTMPQFAFCSLSPSMVNVSGGPAHSPA